MLTKGWDTISIIKQNRINTELKKMWGNVDSKFYYKFNEDVFISGEFLPWRVVNGGGGKFLKMELPIKKGVLNLQGNQFDLDNSIAIVQVTLTFVSGSNSKNSNSSKIFLKTAFTYIGGKSNKSINSEEGGIFPIKFLDNGGKLGLFSETVLMGICHYLIENPKQLSLFFAEIDFLKEMCPTWLRPVKTAYTYSTAGYLCILAVCSDRDISQLSTDINLSDLNFSGDSCFIISSKLVLLNMILPGIYSLYQSTNFEIAEKRFVNLQDLSMNPMKVGLLYYTPVVYQNANEGILDDNCVNISYKGYCDLRANIVMNWSGKVVLSFSQKNGKLVLQKESEDFFHSEDLPWYFKYLPNLISLIVPIIVASISDNLIDKIEENCISIDVNKMNAVEWFKEKEILSSVYLKDSLVLEYL